MFRCPAVSVVWYVLLDSQSISDVVYFVFGTCYCTLLMSYYLFLNVGRFLSFLLRKRFVSFSDTRYKACSRAYVAPVSFCCCLVAMVHKPKPLSFLNCNGWGYDDNDECLVSKDSGKSTDLFMTGRVVKSHVDVWTGLYELIDVFPDSAFQWIHCQLCLKLS